MDYSPYVESIRTSSCLMPHRVKKSGASLLMKNASKELQSRRMERLSSPRADPVPPLRGTSKLRQSAGSIDPTRFR